MIKLGEIITKYPRCEKDPVLLRNTLKDLYPQERPATITVLASVVELGINKEIRNLSELTSFERKRYINKLENEKGYSDEIINTAIDIWWEAYEPSRQQNNKVIEEENISVESEPIKKKEKRIQNIKQNKQIESKDDACFNQANEGWKWIVGMALFLLLAALLVFGSKSYLSSTKYNMALDLYNKGYYSDAESYFHELGDYRYSSAMKKECIYQQANQAFDAKKYEEASKLYGRISGYADSETKKDYCHTLLTGKEMTSLTSQDIGNSSSNSNMDDKVASGSLLKVDDIKTVFFGSYEQDNDLSNGKEPIEWLVLDKENGKMLIISKYALDCCQYHNSLTNITWTNCTLNEWLNNSFFENAFSDEDKKQIINIDYGMEGIATETNSSEDATKDKVFLLNTDEVKQYFSSNEARRCALTPYAKAHGGWGDEFYKTEDNEAACWWWLRSQGTVQSFASIVLSSGEIANNCQVNYSKSVRPALWIEMNTETEDNENSILVLNDNHDDKEHPLHDIKRGAEIFLHVKISGFRQQGTNLPHAYYIVEYPNGNTDVSDIFTIDYSNWYSWKYQLDDSVRDGEIVFTVYVNSKCECQSSINIIDD